MRRATAGVLLTLLIVAAPIVSPVALATAADDGDASGPPDRWATTVGGDDDDKLATGVRTDDGYLVVGWSNSSTSDEAHDGYVAKLDRTGETEWERSYGGSGTDRLYDVKRVGDGYLVAGMATDDVTDTWDGWVMKLGPDGQTQWERTYGGDSAEAFWSLAVDDGRIYVGGWRDDGGSDEAWAMELRSDGEPVWSETYDTSYSGADEYVNSAFVTDDGELLMTGSVLGSTADPSDAWVLKVGDDGDRKWDEIYGGGRFDRVHDAAAAPDGGYVLAGETASDGTGEEDGWMLKINENGAKQWDRTFGTPKADAFFGIHSDPDGGYAVSGAKHVLGKEGADGWVVKTDSEGQRQWGDTYGESHWDKFWPVVEGHGGGYLAIGESTSFGDSRDGYVVRIGGPEVAAIQDADENDSGTRVAFEDSRLRAVTLSDSNVSGVLSVAERADLSALSPPGDPVYGVTVNAEAAGNAPEAAENATAAVEFGIRTDAVDAELSDLRIARQTEDGWSVLETTVVSRANGSVASEENSTDALGGTRTEVSAENGTAVLSAEAPVDSTLVVTAVPAPEASVDATEVVSVGESAELSAAGSTAENGTLTAYEWTVGEASLSGRTASVSFDSPGERAVNLTVIDENGLRDGAATTLLVNDRPEVEVDAPDEVTVGSAGSFSADVSDEVGDVTVTWQFANSEVTGESVEHSFGSPGTETVAVVVEDEYGATATTQVEVDVRAQDGDPSGTEGTTATEGTTSGTDAETPDSTGGIPGFGVGAAVVALLAAVLLARGRR